MRDKRYIYSRTSVYHINYHIVWCVKYRNRVLNADVEQSLRQILSEIAADNGFTVVDVQVGEMDHVHCFVSAPPTLSISFIVQHLKCASAVRLFREYPTLRKTQRKHQLWNPSYFVETIGSTSDENIRRYIVGQSKTVRG